MTPVMSPDNQGNMDMLARISSAFNEKGLTLAIAESCTGGLLGHTITSVPGCSDWFLGGVISYSNEVKVKLLNVSEETLKEHGAVSSETALEMAEGVRRSLTSDVSVAVTGVAGPGGGSREKPVGTVYLALDFSKKTGLKPIVKKLELSGTRAEIKDKTVKEAIACLLNALS
ncbi:ADP-ribose pyrophosphatase of COG1058 family / Nicotinamide-nucleotide amidase [hydrothermal vent metagenome]|uniref:ADP-ribose pyrophosphatase of COG1058 family / Nicotinamide-nucleotide amidase n=1 Tax=hydrothermal vent metagenome TaxID=652676 RepID=A0A3B0QP83_9ZZZZ